MAFGGHKTLTHLTLQGNDQNDMLPPLCEVLRNPKCNLKYLRYISLTTAENPQPVNRASTNLDGNAVQIRGGRNPLFWLDTPRQYSCLENPMDGGAWWATVHGVAKSWLWQHLNTMLNWVRSWSSNQHPYKGREIWTQRERKGGHGKLETETGVMGL